MLEGVPEHIIPGSESGYLKKMRYTILLSISLDKAILLTEKHSKPVASDIIPTSLVGLRGGGGWPPPLSVVFTITTHNKGVFRPIFVLTAAKRIRRQSPRARAGRVKRRGAGEGELGHDDS